MPFFQSVAVRLGVTNVLENMGVDKETAGWIAAGASLVTAVATADLHGHIAGEALAQGAHHMTGHLASHGASHVVSHGTSHAVSHSASHAVSHGTSHAVNESTNYAVHELSDTHSAFDSHADLARSGCDHTNNFFDHHHIGEKGVYTDEYGNEYNVKVENYNSSYARPLDVKYESPHGVNKFGPNWSDNKHNISLDSYQGPKD